MGNKFYTDTASKYTTKTYFENFVFTAFPCRGSHKIYIYVYI